MKKELLFSLIFNVSMVLISLGFVAYLSKNLSLSDFGNYQFILTLIGVVSILGFNGLNIVINRNILNKKDYIFIELFPVVYKIILKIFFVLILFFTFFKILIINNEKIDFIIIALLFLPLIGLEKYEAVLYAKQKFKLIRTLNLLNVILYVIFSVVLLHFYDNYLVIFLSMFIVKLVIVLYGFTYSKKILDIKFDNHKLDIADEFKESSKLSFLSFFNLGIGYLDKIIIGFLDAKQLAVYSIAILIPNKVKDQIKLLIVILLQDWAKNGPNIYIEKVRYYINIILGLSILFSFLLSWSAKIYIPLLFTDEYLAGIKVIWIVSATIPFILSAYIYEFFIITFHNTSFYQVVTYLKQIIYLLLLIVLIPMFDIIGAAFAILIRSFFDFMVNMIYYHRLKGRFV